MPLSTRGEVEMGAIVVDEPITPTSARVGRVESEKDRRESVEDLAMIPLPVKPPPTLYQRFLTQLESIVENNFTTALMSLFTLWALFGTDIKLAATSKDSDNAFLVIISIIFFFFVAELVAVSLYKPQYLVIPDFHLKPNESQFQRLCRVAFGFGSFYFWLDLIATVSLIFEVCFLLFFYYLLLMYVN